MSIKVRRHKKTGKRYYTQRYGDTLQISFITKRRKKLVKIVKYYKIKGRRAKFVDKQIFRWGYGSQYRG